MTDIVLRFVIGGVIVSMFALIGDLFNPKSFGGLFGAAPSVALATLGLTLAKEGRNYTAVECRSMVVGAFALLGYAVIVTWLLLRRRMPAKNATLLAMPVWFAIAFCGWALFLR